MTTTESPHTLPAEFTEFMKTDAFLTFGEAINYVRDVAEGKEEDDVHDFIKHLFLAVEEIEAAGVTMAIFMTHRIDEIRSWAMRHPEHVFDIATAFNAYTLEGDEDKAETYANSLGETFRSPEWAKFNQKKSHDHAENQGDN